MRPIAEEIFHLDFLYPPTGFLIHRIGIGDITCFSSWKKAEEWVKDKISRDELAGNPKYEEWNEDVKMLFVDDIVKKARKIRRRVWFCWDCLWC